jgi:hypothetical protein
MAVGKLLQCKDNILVRMTYNILDSNHHQKKKSSKIDRSITTHFLIRLDTTPVGGSTSPAPPAGGATTSSSSALSPLISYPPSVPAFMAATPRIVTAAERIENDAVADRIAVYNKITIESQALIAKILGISTLSSAEKHDLIVSVKQIGDEAEDLKDTTIPSMISNTQNLLISIGNTLNSLLPTLPGIAAPSSITIDTAAMRKFAVEDILPSLAKLYTTNIRFDNVQITYLIPEYNPNTVPLPIDTDPYEQPYTDAIEQESIKHKIGGVFGSSTNDFYFKNGEVSFNVSLLNNKNKTIFMPMPAVPQATVDRYDSVDFEQVVPIGISSTDPDLSFLTKKHNLQISTSSRVDILPVFLLDKTIALASDVSISFYILIDKNAEDHFAHKNYLYIKKNALAAAATAAPPALTPSSSTTVGGGGP